MFLRNGYNEHGTPISHHRCDECARDFTVTPRVPIEIRDQWDSCMDEDCNSYEPTRDAELYLALGMAVTEQGENND